jgi:hypothetical protein
MAFFFKLTEERCFCADTTRNCVNRTSSQNAYQRCDLKIDPMKMRQIYASRSVIR